MTDLTKIEKPFGLLDKETQEALRQHFDHGGLFEAYTYGGFWTACEDPCWQNASTYRAKPEPRKPRDWWVAATGIAFWLFPNREDAVHATNHGVNVEIIHVREVIEDQP